MDEETITATLLAADIGFVMGLINDRFGPEECLWILLMRNIKMVRDRKGFAEHMTAGFIQQQMSGYGGLKDYNVAKRFVAESLPLLRSMLEDYKQATGK